MSIQSTARGGHASVTCAGGVEINGWTVARVASPCAPFAMCWLRGVPPCAQGLDFYIGRGRPATGARAGRPPVRGGGPATAHLPDICHCTVMRWAAEPNDRDAAKAASLRADRRPAVRARRRRGRKAAGAGPPRSEMDGRPALPERLAGCALETFGQLVVCRGRRRRHRIVALHAREGAICASDEAWAPRTLPP